MILIIPLDLILRGNFFNKTERLESTLRWIINIFREFSFEYSNSIEKIIIISRQQLKYKKAFAENIIRQFTNKSKSESNLFKDIPVCFFNYNEKDIQEFIKEIGSTDLLLLADYIFHPIPDILLHIDNNIRIIGAEDNTKLYLNICKKLLEIYNYNVNTFQIIEGGIKYYLQEDFSYKDIIEYHSNSSDNYTSLIPTSSKDLFNVLGINLLEIYNLRPLKLFINSNDDYLSDLLFDELNRKYGKFYLIDNYRSLISKDNIYFELKDSDNRKQQEKIWTYISTNDFDTKNILIRGKGKLSFKGHRSFMQVTIPPLDKIKKDLSLLFFCIISQNCKVRTDKLVNHMIKNNSYAPLIRNFNNTIQLVNSLAGIQDFRFNSKLNWYHILSNKSVLAEDLPEKKTIVFQRVHDMWIITGIGDDLKPIPYKGNIGIKYLAVILLYNTKKGVLHTFILRKIMDQYFHRKSSGRTNTKKNIYDAVKKSFKAIVPKDLNKFIENYIETEIEQIGLKNKELFSVVEIKDEAWNDSFMQ